MPLGPAHAPVDGAVYGGAVALVVGAEDDGAVTPVALEFFFLLAKAQCLLQRARCSGVKDPAMFGGITNLDPWEGAFGEFTPKPGREFDIALNADAAAGDKRVPWIFL